MSRSTTSMCHRAMARTVLLLLLVSNLSLSTYAQVVGGTIQGTIADPKGAVLPEAKIEIVNLSTQIVTILTSNVDGFYSAPNLLPGNYKVTVTRSGFATALTEVILTVGAQRVVNVTMHIGTVSEVVKVQTEVPEVELATSEISDVVNGRTIRELPLNGRDWTQLATLEPGIASIRTQPSVGASDRGQRGFGTQMTVNGGRPAQNNYRLDGTSINDYSNSAPGSVLGTDLGSDAVGEFSVLSSTYPAEYGRSSGGVINAITRSGSNTFHGSVYEFLRNSALDASNYFDTTKPPFKRNQFGVTAGGPIVKDHTFIFGNYEGLRQSLGITQTSLVPTQNARNGQLSSGPVTVDPKVVPYLPIWPLPNTGSCPAGTICDVGTFKLQSQQITPENYFTTRVDHKFSVNDSLDGTYMRDTATISQPDELGIKVTGYTTRRQLVTLEESHVFNPQVVNSARVGYSRVVGLVGQTLKALSPLASDPSLGFAAPGRPVGEIDVNGVITNFSGGLGAISNYNFHWNSFQGYDDAFVTRGKHSLKFGVAVERIQENMSASDSPNGIYSFGSLGNFLTAHPDTFAANLGETGIPRNMRQTIFGVYAADDLRLLPNLTMNLGLRYEMSTVPSEIHGKIASLRNLTDSALFCGDPSITVGNPPVAICSPSKGGYFSNPTLHDFEPRFGFSWDPFKNGKTALRGGFGMFDVLPLPYETQNLTLFAAPYYLLGTIGGLRPGDFPNAFNLINANTTQSLRVNFIQPNPSRNYVMEWNLNVQRQVSESVAVMIGYTGSRGVHQPFRVEDMNIPLPDIQVPEGYVWSAATQGHPVNGTFGQIEGLMWIASSSYHSLQAQIKKNMSHGLQAQASFTYGRSIDTSSAGSIGDNFHNSVSSLPFFSTKLNRGPSDFNVGKNLVTNLEWEIPSPKSLSGAAGWALSGWQLGGIFEASSGTPFSVIITGDPLKLGNTDPFGRPSRLNGPGCNNPVNPGNPFNYIKLECFGLPQQTPAIAGVCQTYGFDPTTTPPNPGIPGTCANLLGNAGRNQLNGPGLINFDLSLFKNMKFKRISENFTAQFRVEFFNVLNHPNFSPPVDFNALYDNSGASLAGSPGNPGAGSIDSTVTTSRQMQVALKLIW
jgi:hypothetical protein